jgi:hypothetical protein
MSDSNICYKLKLGRKWDNLDSDKRQSLVIKSIKTFDNNA